MTKYHNPAIAGKTFDTKDEALGATEEDTTEEVIVETTEETETTEED